MKKVVIYVCAGLSVLLLSIAIIGQKKTALHVDNEENNVTVDSSDVVNMPVLKFAKNRYDFGAVKKEDMPLHIVFEFQNEGSVPLVIQKVDVSCGCLSAEHPKEPIAPKQEGSIQVKIDSKDFTGTLNKTLFVKSNATEDVILLRIVGQVK